MLSLLLSVVVVVVVVVVVGRCCWMLLSVALVPSGASDTIACHARRERERAEVAKV